MREGSLSDESDMIGGVSVAAIASLATSVISTGVAVYSSMEQSKAAERTAKYNERVAQNEAKIRRDTALENIRRKRKENQRYLSSQMARMSKAGIAMEGTPIAVLGETAGVLELELFDIMRDAQIGVQRSLSAGQQARFAGQQASRAAKTQAGASLLSGASTFGQQYGDFYEQGLVPNFLGGKPVYKAQPV